MRYGKIRMKGIGEAHQKNEQVGEGIAVETPT